MSQDELLSQARFTAPNTTTSYYLVQLNSTSEKKLNDQLVSNAIASLITDSCEKRLPFTHIFVQTHGWGQSPSVAVKNPFNRLISGLLDDSNKSSDDNFNPLFVCFTWESSPSDVLEDSTAFSNQEINRQIVEATNKTTDRDLGTQQEEQSGGGGLLGKLENALNAAKLRGNESQARRDIIQALADEGENDDDDDDDMKIDVEKTLTELEESERGMGGSQPDQGEQQTNNEDNYNALFDKLNSLFNGPLYPLRKTVVNPIQYAVFGRLLKRGRKTGVQMAIVLEKLMSAAVSVGTRPKVCVSGNSAGGHVLIGALAGKDSPKLPYKVHTVVFHQGALVAKWFESDGRFGEFTNNVAGPVIATTSSNDYMLRNVFGLISKDPALGLVGFPAGKKYMMKSKEEIVENDYEWTAGEMFTIDGSVYIDEGPKLLGAHGDYKEDESTMW